MPNPGDSFMIIVPNGGGSGVFATANLPPGASLNPSETIVNF
jgi:hypothetical protein